MNIYNTSFVLRELNNNDSKTEFFQQINATSEMTHHCQKIYLQWNYISIPILIMSKIIGPIVGSYHISLIPNEKNIVVFLEIVISFYRFHRN